MPDHFTNAYALLIGVGESAYPKLSLPVTVKDMQALRAVLSDPQLCGYDEQHIRLLHDTAATKANILDGLDWLKTCTNKNKAATAVVFYSGHGWRETDSGCYYLLQHDIEALDVKGSALNAQIFTDKLRAIQSKRLLVVIDSCHAQGMANSKDDENVNAPKNFEQVALPKGLVEDLKQGAGRAVFTSSLGSQSSYVRKENDLSVYTYHLIEALQGAGNKSGDTHVRLSNLMNYLGRMVRESTKAMGVEQTPFFDFTTEDFPVALLLGGKGLTGAGWRKESARFPQTSVQVTQTITGNGNIFSGAGNVVVHRK